MPKTSYWSVPIVEKTSIAHTDTHTHSSIRKSRGTINSNDFYVYEMCCDTQQLQYTICYTRLIRCVCVCVRASNWLATLTKKQSKHKARRVEHCVDKPLSWVSLIKILCFISMDLCFGKISRERMRKAQNMLASFMIHGIYFAFACVCARTSYMLLCGHKMWHTHINIHSLSQIHE